MVAHLNSVAVSILQLEAQLACTGQRLAAVSHHNALENAAGHWLVQCQVLIMKVANVHDP